MYAPPHFAADPATVDALLQSARAADLVTPTADGLGADGYVSPGWYTAKREHGRVVPIWDYTPVHVHGTLVVHDDPVWLAVLVRRLTDLHEAGRARPWSADDAPAEYIAGQLRGIVGLELVVSRVEAKAKLSQNRSPADIDGVVSGLRDAGLDELAEDVESARP